MERPPDNLNGYQKRIEMKLIETTDNLIDHLILKIPISRDVATEAIILTLAWLMKRGLLRVDKDT